MQHLQGERKLVLEFFSGNNGVQESVLQNELCALKSVGQVFANGFLDHTAKNAEGWGYCVFGKVVDGMDTVNAIRAVRTTMRAGHQDVPAEDVVIEKAEVVEGGGAA